MIWSVCPHLLGSLCSSCDFFSLKGKVRTYEMGHLVGDESKKNKSIREAHSRRLPGWLVGSRRCQGTTECTDGRTVLLVRV
jgi:hypothetical protein